MARSIKDIAEELHCSIYNVYAALHSGKLQATKVGKYWNITEEAIQAYTQNRIPRGGVRAYVLHKGDRFGYWTVVDPKAVTLKSGARMVLCRCICGKEHLVNQYKLIHGKTRSCGCQKGQIFTTTIAKKKATLDEKSGITGYEKGYRDAQLAILKAYCKQHEVVTPSDLQDVAEFIGLSTDEIKKLLITSYDKEKKEIYDKASKEAKSQDELIHILWKNGFVLEDFEKYGFSADTVWKTVMEEE